MDKKRKGKKRRLRLRKGVLLNIFLFLLGAFLLYSYFTKMHVCRIDIVGNNQIKDATIIEAAGIKDYPKLFSVSKKKMKNAVSGIPLIDSVKVKRNLFGKVKIEVTEAKVLFFYKYNNKYTTSSYKSIENSNDIYGVPTLINFTPDTIFEELVKSLNKINYSIVKMINEIEYTPYKTSDGKVIDEYLFTFKMNDGNTVIIDTLNIKNLNEYNKIYASLALDGVKGVLHLDTITKDNIYFQSYEAILLEEIENAKTEEEVKEEQ